MTSLWKNIDEQPFNGRYIFAAFIAVFILTALYFSPWQTHAIYGDDLFVYYAFNKTSDWDLITLSQKYRPINTALIRIFISVFNKNLALYFYFNVLVQTISTIIFIKIATLVTRSLTLSFIAGIVLAFSRFHLFNITQLYYGGALEGLAMIFFLCSLLYILRILAGKPLPAAIQFRSLLWSIFFANMAIYTHERYIVLFPFIALCMLMPPFKSIQFKRRAVIIALAILSIALNYIIKRYVYHISFFMGTGNVNITFSPSSAYAFLVDGINDIIGINSGPEYLAGYPFSSLSSILMIVAYLSIALTPVLLGTAIIRSLRDKSLSAERNRMLVTLFILLILFTACLVPAIVTIRLEQRWLQASTAVWILMFLVVLNNFSPENTRTKIGLLFAVSSIAINYTYLQKGANNIYLCNAQNRALLFRQAIKNGVIKTSSTTLFIQEQKKDTNNENEINWIFQNGTFFEFYGQTKKKIAFVDSTDRMPGTSHPSVSPGKSQVVDIKDKVIDITDKYISNYPTY